MLPSSAAPLLRLLWSGEWTAQSLPADASPGSRPVLRRPSGDGSASLYLPSKVNSDWASMVAHAAAHRQFGGPPMPRRGLKPIQQAVLGALEDARVEYLACEHWPGLRGWWLPHHPGYPETVGPGFEGLLARLSACLLDPLRPDPHPWIERVRQIFFEPDRRTLALRTPDQVRHAASLLGNEIGQMRIPFQPDGYRVYARYRDDNNHLWLPDDEDRTALTLPDLQDTSADSLAPLDPTNWVLADPVARHPEWDYRIGRYRPEWVTVHEHHWPSRTSDSLQRTGAERSALRSTPLDRTSRHRSADCDAEGEELHADAVVEYLLARRAATPCITRLWHRVQPQPIRAGVLLLVDASVSTLTELALWQRQVEQAARHLERLGMLGAVWAFASDGRHRVRLQRLKDWTERCETVPWGHLQPGGSTRLGAALRHASLLCERAAQQQALQTCTVVLISDGEMHDVDVHDSRYLGADFRRAIRELSSKGLGLQALVSGPAPEMFEALGAGACHRSGPAGWRTVLARVQRPRAC